MKNKKTSWIVCAFGVICSVVCTGNANTPIAYWAFDSNSGPTVYDSAGGNNGTIHGALWIDGIAGGALDFDGVDNYIEIDNSPDQQIGTNQITITAWIWLGKEIPNTQKVIAQKRQSNYTMWSFVILGPGYDGSLGNQLAFHDSDGMFRSKCLSTTDLELNKWYHVVATDDAGQIKIYINGQLDTSTDYGYGIPADIVAPILIGSAADTSYFDGFIDEVTLFNTALSAQQTQQMYQDRLPKFLQYHVDTDNGNDDNDGLTPGAAFATIQKGIDNSKNWDTLLVWPGTYDESLVLFGKSITAKSVADAAILRSTDDYAVSFYYGEGRGCAIKNFVIKDSAPAAIFLNSSSPRLSNLTIVDNSFGILAYAGADPEITNCILWNNTFGDLDGCQAFDSYVQTEIGQLAYWKFDDANGTTAADSMGSNNGDILGTPNWTTGQVAGSMDFDGITNYVEIPNNQNQQISTNQITISAWIWLDEEIINTQKIIVRKNQDNYITWSFAIFGAGFGGSVGNQLVFSDSNGTDRSTCLSQTDLNINQWYNVVVTDDAGRIKIYINGQLDASIDNASGIPSYINAPIVIGSTGDDLFFDGLIDEVMIFDRKVFTAEIEQIYRNGINGFGFVPDPLFADADNGDYHLRSTSGRYDPNPDKWVFDNVNSPCIDIGNLTTDFTAELLPNGERVNAGAYGGTAYASMSSCPTPGDMNCDNNVNMKDFAILAKNWQRNIADIIDLAANWLIEPPIPN